MPPSPGASVRRVAPNQRSWAARQGGLLAVALVAVVGASGPLAATSLRAADEGSPALELRAGDRIVLVGNTFAERMIEFGHFEALLSTLLPEHQLTFRNLAWSADELTRQRFYTPETPYKVDIPGWNSGESMFQPRPLNFGDIYTHLHAQRADVILCCFGMNESFRGEPGLAKFADDLRSLVDSLASLQFNGHSAPRLVLVSPIPHEPLEGLPDPAAHNEQLAAYTAAIETVAAEKSLPVVNLFAALAPLMESGAGDPLTFNGIHQTAYGDWVAALEMARQLGLLDGELPRVEIDAARLEGTASGAHLGELTRAGSGLTFEVSGLSTPLPPPPAGARLHPQLVLPLPVLAIRGLPPGEYALQVGQQPVIRATSGEWSQGVRVPAIAAGERAEAVRQACIAKNRQFFYRWRAVNGEYIYGRRKEPFGVVKFPQEMELLDQIVAEGDAHIHALAAEPQPKYLQVIGTDP